MNDPYALRAVVETLILTDGGEVFDIRLSGTLNLVSELDADLFEAGLRDLIERHANNSLEVFHADPRQAHLSF